MQCVWPYYRYTGLQYLAVSCRIPNDAYFNAMLQFVIAWTVFTWLNCSHSIASEIEYYKA